MLKTSTTIFIISDSSKGKDWNDLSKNDNTVTLCRDDTQKYALRQ